MTLFFDLDGTLADTDRDIREAWKAALNDLGLVCEDFDRRFIAGPPIDEMTKTLFPKIYTPLLADQVREGFARHYDNDGFPNTFEYPGIHEILSVLKNDGHRLFIVTNKRYLGATAMAKKFGWDQLFERLYTGDMYAVKGEGPKLRKPELLARVLAENSLNPQDTVMIGDTISDFEAARVNQVKAIGVSWGYGKPEELAQAELTVTSAEALRAVI